MSETEQNITTEPVNWDELKMVISGSAGHVAAEALADALEKLPANNDYGMILEKALGDIQKAEPYFEDYDALNDQLATALEDFVDTVEAQMKRLNDNPAEAQEAMDALWEATEIADAIVGAAEEPMGKPEFDNKIEELAQTKLEVPASVAIPAMSAIEMMLEEDEKDGNN